MPKWLVLDTESNALFDYAKPADAQGQPRVAAISMIKLDDNLDVTGRLDVLIKPDGWVFDDNSDAAKVNKLTQARLMAEGVPVSQALTYYRMAIEDGHAVVAHNSRHDLKMMRAELRLAGMDDLFARTPSICTMTSLIGVCRIPRADGKGIKMPKLSEAMAHFKIPHDQPHTSGGDADAVLALFRKCMQIGVLPEPTVNYAKEGTSTKAGKARAARKVAEADPEPAQPDLPIARQELPE